MQQKKFAPELIAPCGMNCGICMAFLREKNRCPSCRGPDNKKASSVIRCKIKTCENIQKGHAEFCFECERAPCSNLKHLDKRYRTRYNMSMVENLKELQDRGIDKFLETQKTRYNVQNVEMPFLSTIGNATSVDTLKLANSHKAFPLFCSAR